MDGNQVMNFYTFDRMFEDKCPRCGADFNDKEMPDYPEADTDTDWYMEGYCSEACYREYEADCNHDGIGIPRYKRITEEQLKYIKKLEGRAKVAMDFHVNEEHNLTIWNLFFDNAPDGDFKWEQEIAGDWHVYGCYAKDCPVGWHTIAYGLDISREGDVCKAELWNIDHDGNRGDSTYWESGEDSSHIVDKVRLQINEYFYEWFKYWIHCAFTSTDVLLCENRKKSVGTFIKSAEDNLRSLEMGTVKKEKL